MRADSGGGQGVQRLAQPQSLHRKLNTHPCNLVLHEARDLEEARGDDRHCQEQPGPHTRAWGAGSPPSPHPQTPRAGGPYR